MSHQLDLCSHQTGAVLCENRAFLTEQLITYIGNKRCLLDFIGQGVNIIKERLNKKRLKTFDVFSGSGVVSRYLKQHSSQITANDVEEYSHIINSCYLSNKSEVDMTFLNETFIDLCRRLKTQPLREGFIYELYSPKDEHNIKPGERVFYTPRNARFLDTARQYIEEIPSSHRKFFLSPLLSEASVHANTSGVFKGFYKNSETGLGQFGGNNKDALVRILGDIEIKIAIFSNYECEYQVLKGDSNTIVDSVEEVDLAYLDPPYNQHPYGSNYFMLNLLAHYVRPHTTSSVSGIPDNWYRSDYNKSRRAYRALKQLTENIKAKYLLVSFNSEGFIPLDDMIDLLTHVGKVEVLETKYNTFRGSRNLSNRDIHLKEYLYLVEKN